MGYQDVIVSVEDGIGTIILNRPDKLNSFANQMRQEMVAAVAELAGNDAVRVIVITGAGRGFCTGADVTYLKEIVDTQNDTALRELVDAGRAVVTSIRSAPQPVIASINGPAAYRLDPC